MNVTIYTDGACINNPGTGGWAAILECDSKAKEISGCEIETTNNRMEILAVVKGLQALKRTVDQIDIFSDSQYVVSTINNKYKIRKNYDLWNALKVELAKHNNVNFHWVKGHDGHKQNERCDYLASTQAKLLEQQLRRK